MKIINENFFVKNNVDVFCIGCNCFDISETKEIKICKSNDVGNVYRLGKIDILELYGFVFVKCYVKYSYGDVISKLNFDAVKLCMEKVNKKFTNKTIGILKYMHSVTETDWKKIKQIIDNTLENKYVIFE